MKRIDALYRVDKSILSEDNLRRVRSDLLIKAHGRALRFYPGKKEPIVVDIFDKSNKVPEFSDLNKFRRQFYQKQGYEIAEGDR